MAKLIGTAGHVDHGKTALIAALTGIDADRLPEEKKRGMTIEIGFAYLDLPGGRRASIVDVPGHEKFVTNMLVGALGIDVILLCIAADASIMPQTREHFEILNLLPGEQMVVAMTRCDLVDEEWRDLVRQEIREMLAETRFANSKIIETSSKTGEGMDEMRSEIVRILELPSEARTGPWFMPVDRVFSIKGHGAVVTGTLAQGSVQVGETAELVPGHVKVRVRKLQIHDQPVEQAEFGSRTAMNLGGIHMEDIHRGSCIGAPGCLFETKILDASMVWVTKAKHAERVRLSIGSAEAIGKVFLSEVDAELVQIRLETLVACAMNQPLIVRRYSPPVLLGGGRVTVPNAKLRRKNEKAQTVARHLDREGQIVQVVSGSAYGVPTEEICRLLGESPQNLGVFFEALKSAGSLLGFAGWWMTQNQLFLAESQLLHALRDLHATHPTTATHPREKVMQLAALPFTGKPLDRILAAWATSGVIRLNGTLIASADFQIQLTPRQAELLQRVEELCKRAGINAPHPKEVGNTLGVPFQAIEEILRLGLEAGQLVRVGDGLYYPIETLNQIRTEIAQKVGATPFAVADLRDSLGTSRKYLVPLLEYFDATGFTLRQGDRRVIR